MRRNVHKGSQRGRRKGRTCVSPKVTESADPHACVPRHHDTRVLCFMFYVLRYVQFAYVYERGCECGVVDAGLQCHI